MRVLIANRGEIAVRVAKTLHRLKHEPVMVYAEDEVESQHRTASDHAIALAGSGPSAYLDQDQVIEAAVESDAEAVHPGYGFLSENAEFARRCIERGLTFIGPSPQALRIFGDKVAARDAAIAAGAPVLDATAAGVTETAVREFLGSHPRGVMIKALAGGGGRGMRIVRSDDDVAEAYRRCVEEARISFANAAVFAEELLEGARHIEIQVVSAPSNSGTTALALSDRDCSVQRRRQKLIEIGPAPWLPAEARERMHVVAANLCASVGYRGIATVEFLFNPVDASFVFLEVNPRIQVEHTVTEQVTGVDLVEVQLRVAQGTSIDDLGLPAGVRSDGDRTTGSCLEPSGLSVQCRINMETLAPDGSVSASVGKIEAFEPPDIPGVRVDTHGYPGMHANPRYDSLLAKLVVTINEADLSQLFDRALDALDAFVIDGVSTNVELLHNLLKDERLRGGRADTTFVERNLTSLIDLDSPVENSADVEDDKVIVSPMAGTIVEVATVSEIRGRGATVAVVEAMKMQHAIHLKEAAQITQVFVKAGDIVEYQDPLMAFELEDHAEAEDIAEEVSLDLIRPDLEELLERRAFVHDETRPEAVAKRRSRGRRTTRENVNDFLDEDSLIEYGALAIAAQRGRRSEDDLIRNTPADGLVGGVGTSGANVFGKEVARVVVMAYDFTVLAGTQGRRNHAKIDRLFEIARRRRLPLVVWAEGGGGRPADVDGGSLTGRLDGSSFNNMGRLASRVPIVAIVSGRCFAGNAALAGMSDVIIATPDANVGMSGPVMIEGGGLGVFSPDDIGPIDVQAENGVVDILAEDDADAVVKAKKFLAFVQGSLTDWEAPDSRRARHVVPADRLQSYSPHAVLDAIVDVGSIMELRERYGKGIITAFARIEGRPFGVIINNTQHLGAAIDAEASDKLWDFLALCDQYELPVISLCDTPGFMVGPDAEKDGGVKKFSRLFIRGASLRVPLGVVILRKGYGLGAMAMAGGSFKVPDFTVSWPTGEVGGMGLEGAVSLGYKKELEAVHDPDERQLLYNRLISEAYRDGRALTSATNFEIDDVIDPADTRTWLLTLTREYR